MRCLWSVLRSHMWFGALYPHTLLYTLLQALEDCRWLRPSGVVGIDIGELHRTLTPNHERPRHRKLPRCIPVIDLQINAPDVRVKLPQSCCQGEDEAELPRHAIAWIAQHLNSSAFFSAIDSDWSGRCGEMATSWAPSARISG